MALFGSMMKRALAQMQRHSAPVKQPPHLGKGLPPEPYGQQPMNLIQVPDLTRKLVTRYGLREKAPAPTLSPEIVPVVLVDDLIAESDLIRPRIRPCAGFCQVNTAAAQGLVGLRNPSGSGVIIHLQYFVIGGTTGSAWRVHFTGTPNTNNPTPGAFRNGLFPSQTPSGILNFDNSAPTPGGAVLAFVRAATLNNTIYPFDAVIDENQSIQLRHDVAVTGFYEFTAVWTEEDKR